MNEEASRQISSEQHEPGPAPKDTMPAKKSRIFIVDDHTMFREGLRQLIESDPEFKVCGDAASAEEGMTGIRETKPDLVIVDISLSGTSGIDLIKAIKKQYEELPVLVVSMHDEALYAERALHAGARGYIMKDASSATVLQAIRRVLAGGVYLSPEMTRRLVDGIARVPHAAKAVAPAERLSDREYEIFDLIGRGYSTMEIAGRLRLSHKTIASHRENIRRKLGLPNSAALLRYAMQCSRDSGA